MDIGSRVVLVDDDEDDYLLTRDMLEELSDQDYSLEWVSNAADARALMANDPPDILLLDYRLGADDGIALIPELRGTGFDGPIIMLTGQRDRELENAALKAGAVDYLSKQHVNAYELERSLRYAWMRKRAETHERERLEAESRRREAEAANLAKSEFLAYISHELRTPLAAMLAYADLLSLKVRDEETADHTHAISRNGRHLQALLDDMLDLSVIESGKLDLDISNTSIPQLIADVGATVEIQCREKGLEFVLDLPEMMPEYIETDKKRLAQMLFNLAGNAVKFTDEGSITLRIRYDATSNRVVFEVEDTGPGIDEADLKTIFEPFQRIRGSGNDRPGVGLGLTVTHKLAENLGASIAVRSDVGVGTCFVLSLPASTRSEVKPVDQAAVRESLISAKVSTELDGLILVVDDAEDIRKSVAGLLRSVGARVVTLASGEALMHYLDTRKEEKADLILLDMHMPGIDGYEAARQIRAAGRDTPIIALTAAVLEGARERCLAAGCDDYLGKPVEPMRLFACVGHWLGAEHSDAAAKSYDNGAPSEAGEVRAATSNASAAKILIVDDAVDAREATRKMLEFAGFTVLTAASGKEAEAAIDSSQPESVILDLNLGEDNGIDLARRIRNRDTSPPIKMLGLSGQPLDLLDPEERDLFDVYLTKPFRLDQLLRSLADCGVLPDE